MTIPTQIPTLDPRPTRRLTSRECANILGSTIGGLLQVASRDDVIVAIEWWAAHHKEAFDAIPTLVRPSFLAD